MVKFAPSLSFFTDNKICGCTGYEPLFPIMEKGDVNGTGAQEIFKYLKCALPYPVDRFCLLAFNTDCRRCICIQASNSVSQIHTECEEPRSSTWKSLTVRNEVNAMNQACCCTCVHTLCTGVMDFGTPLWDVRLPSDIHWNFEKFLIDQSGVPVKVKKKHTIHLKIVDYMIICKCTEIQPQV